MKEGLEIDESWLNSKISTLICDEMKLIPRFIEFCYASDSMFVLLANTLVY